MNVNDDVWVRLTDQGRLRLWQHQEAVACSVAALTGVPQRTHPPTHYRSRDGWTQFQLWELMQIFGEHFYLGMRGTLFEDNEIRLDNPHGSNCGPSSPYGSSSPNSPRS